MMRRLLAAMFVLCTLPSSVRAQVPEGAHITDANLDYTDDSLVVQLNGSAAIGEPRVRTRKGDVRVWFPRLRDHLRFELAGDGKALKRVQIRPGAGTTYLVHFRLGDRRRVDAGSVRVERQGQQARILIPLSQLAPLKTAEPEKAEADEPAPGPAAEAAAPKATTAGAELPPTVESPKKKATRSADTRAALAKLPTKKEPSKPKAAAGIPVASGGGLNMVGLLAISAFLVVVLAVLKVLQRRRGGAERKPVIDVVASRRLGPGHQLMIVRAFGKDHLLSVNGKTTERIASEPAGSEALPSLEAMSPGEAAAPALPQSGTLLSKLMPPARPDMDDMEPESPRSLTPRPRFGDELLKLARTPSPPTAGARNSESVAGLLRLRERAGRG